MQLLLLHILRSRIVIDEIGDTILPSWSYNNCEGFSLLRERLCGLEGDMKVEEILWILDEGE